MEGQYFALLETQAFLSTITHRLHLTTSQCYQDFVPTKQIIFRSDNTLQILIEEEYRTKHHNRCSSPSESFIKRR
ncbi:unnamed protein product [Rotaria sp. Silwood2]|nr:unnamed protein product [Rotaria sp. Silwood2]CAF3005689.1 unnamed protein product [Rotaria sp. Silwood2]CAF3291987.1 unnamed protein product [Rotaria sp. Silwood2]CAF3939584.1 unnamed protein product [Rotaria sp. Silwood2]CAF4433918.1 unnamed protein product [Rotaria sp. Silwood2]